MVPAESPGASAPKSAASASENSPLEIPFRYSHGNNSSMLRHRLRQQTTGAVAQHFGQRVANRARNPWLLQLQNVIVTHGVFTPCKRLMILVDHQEYAVFSFHLINNFQA